MESHTVSRGRWGVSDNLLPAAEVRARAQSLSADERAVPGGGGGAMHRIAALNLPERPNSQGEHWTISHDKGMNWNTWLRFKMKASCLPPLLDSPTPRCASRGRRAAYPPLTLFGAYARPVASLSPCAPALASPRPSSSFRSARTGTICRRSGLSTSTMTPMCCTNRCSTCSRVTTRAPRTTSGDRCRRRSQP